MRQIACAFILGVLALTGCSSDDPDAGSGNSFVPLRSFEKLEISRVVGRRAIPKTYTVSITLNYGDAFIIGDKQTVSCSPSPSTRASLFSTIGAVKVLAKNPEVACPAAMPLDNEKFLSFDREVLVDGCNYSYSGDGFQQMQKLFNRYMRDCTRVVPAP